MQETGTIAAQRLPSALLPNGQNGGSAIEQRVLGLKVGHWALLLALVAVVAPVWGSISRGPTTFDDAYMFWRYAIHLREGLGVAWNPDGIQTYGLTSHTWLWAVLPFTALPVHPGIALQIASAVAGACAMGIMGAAIASNSKYPALRDRGLATAIVTLPLVINPYFVFHLSTGMDTMLSMAAHGALIACVLRYLAQPSLRRACIVGAAAFAAVLTRPENGLVALGVPFLAFLSLRWRDRWRDLLGLLALPVALIGIELVACQLIFGAPLPLSFYAKSLHIYAGFQSTENAVQNLFLAMSIALPFIAIALAAVHRRELPWLIALVVPVVLTFAYLLTIRQVMGWFGRYYLPFLPYLIIPAMLLIDRRLTQGPDLRTISRNVAVALAGLLALAVISWPAQRAVEAAYIKAILPPRIATPPLPSPSADKLPKQIWFDVIQRISDEVVAPLPASAVIAASEVGYLGAAAMGKTLIDLVGLNDTTIGRRGFSMDYLLSRKPDLIWMPFGDYSGLVAKIYSDPRLFERYIVVRDAFNYGIAIRREGPHRAQIEAGVRHVWSTLYPGLTIEDYIVRR